MQRSLLQISSASSEPVFKPRVVSKPQTLRMCFNISGTSKFPAAQTIVRKEKTPPVLLRETFAYGIKYGMGVFCLLDTGKEQIGWVPEKDHKLLEDVRMAYQLPKFRVRIDRATCHTVGDAFTKVVISLICDLDN